MDYLVDFSFVDATAAVAWAVVTALLVVGGWRFSGRAFPGEPAAARVLHTAVLSWSVIVGTATLLGVAGALVPAALLAVVAGAALLLEWSRRPIELQQPAGRPDLTGLIAWAALMLFWMGHVGGGGFLHFPTDWDSLMYHVPIIDQWLQARSLYAPREAVWYNPGNNELVGLWLVAPFSGDFLIALNNVPAVTVFILGATELARQLGLRRPLTLVAVLALAGNHVVFRQITDAENDIAVAGLFLTGLAYAARHARAGRTADLGFAAATLGLLAGVKYFALGYAAVLGLALVAATALTRGYRPAARAAAVALLGAVLLGGYWYIRNTFHTGTPVYPKGFVVDHDKLSTWPPGRDGISGTTLFGSGRPEVAPLTVAAVRAMGGPCYVAALLGMPVCAVWLVVSALWRKQADLRAVRVMIVLALLGSGAIWGVTPFAVETTPGTLNMLLGTYLPVRFGLSFLSVAIIALTIVLQDLEGVIRSKIRRRERRRICRVALMVIAWVPGLVFAAGAAYQFVQQAILVMAPHDFANGLLVSANAALLAGVFFLARANWPGSRRWLNAAFTAALVSGFAVAAGCVAGHWHGGYAHFYDRLFSTDTFGELERRDPSTTRLCVLSYRYYPFLGAGRQFATSRPPWLPTYDALRDYLLLHELNVIVTADDPFPNGWYHDLTRMIEQRPAIFRRVGMETTFAVYEVNFQKLHGD